MSGMESKKDIGAVCVAKDATLQDVLMVIGRNRSAASGIPAGIALVVDKGRKLLGIVTSGDLTRAMVAGRALTEPVSAIMNTKPFVIEGKASAQEIIRRVVNETREHGWPKGRLDKIIMVDEQHRVTDLLSIHDLWQASDIRLKKVGVVGLGYVGLTLALTLADLGFEVRGFDINEKVRKLVAAKKAPFFELGLPELLAEHVGKHFKVASSFADERCDVYFIAVGTPVGEGKRKKPDLSALQAVAESIGEVLKQGDLVVLRSTVPIGTTRDVVTPILEKHSALTAGEDFFIAFAPERTVEGKALEELRTLPQVIGGINRMGANLASDIFNLMTHTIHIVDSLEEAEVVKLINNTYRDVTFAFANEVSLICQRWGIDTNTVVNAANAGYPRSSVPKPSPGVGGYCLDKDPYIFMEGGRAKKYAAKLFEHARAVNTRILEMVAERVVEHLATFGTRQKKDHKIFILGFAFKGKPATSDLRGSPTIALTKMLQKAGYKNIWGFDPVVASTELTGLGVHTVSDMKAGFKGAHAVIIMNNHEDLASPRIQVLLKECAPGAMFFDTWALHGKDDIAKIDGISYHRL